MWKLALPVGPVISRTLVCLFVIATAMATGQSFAAIHTEVGDAGQTQSTAQETGAAGVSLTDIFGSLLSETDADLYLINIVNPAAFSATTFNATGGFLDTQLFLLTLSGAPVYVNDDDPGGLTTLSTLRRPPGPLEQPFVRHGAPRCRGAVPGARTAVRPKTHWRRPAAIRGAVIRPTRPWKRGTATPTRRRRWRRRGSPRRSAIPADSRGSPTPSSPVDDAQRSARRQHAADAHLDRTPGPARLRQPPRRSRPWCCRPREARVR